MNTRNLFISLLIMILGTGILSAQPRGRQTASTRQTSAVTATQPTAQSGKSAAEVKDIPADRVTWQREVFRMLDLTREENAPLYYPPQPDGEHKNLFSLLFENVSKGQLKVYDYLDGKEIFTDEYKVKFDELLNRFWIPFDIKTNARDTVYVVETADIPSNEVTLYYIKELWYMDKNTSAIRTKIISLCPVLVREDETGETRKYPLFWVPFDQAHDLLAGNSLRTSSYNALDNMTTYDYLARRQYKGDIYKVSNLLNQNIMDYCSTPEEIAAEQQRLEKELKDITEGLWEEPHSQVVEREKEAKQQEKSSKKKKKEA